MKKLLDIITIIYMVCIIITCIVMVYYLVVPPKVYVQEWTTPSGVTFYISNAHMTEK